MSRVLSRACSCVSPNVLIAIQFRHVSDPVAAFRVPLHSNRDALQVSKRVVVWNRPPARRDISLFSIHTGLAFTRSALSVSERPSRRVQTEFIVMSGIWISMGQVRAASQVFHSALKRS